MNHIELFAGCGGLSLGLEKQGFELLLANELSPMAGETFAFNALNVDISDSSALEGGKVYWIKSRFNREEVANRLRENPAEALANSSIVSDLQGMQSYEESLRRSLLIGSITDLNDLIAADRKLRKAIKHGLGDGEIDLVSGGPPCQSFSMAGMRQQTNARNQLPWEFADFVENSQPRMALLENVTGILRAFRVDGQAYYAWFEVCKAFALKGYVPLCLHVNAKYVGAAQNRPRFIMLAFREDVFQAIRRNIDDPFIDPALEESQRFFEIVRSGSVPVIGDISCFDVEDRNCQIYRSRILSRLVPFLGRPLVSVKDAIDDLRSKRISPSDYVNYINAEAYGNRKGYRVANTELRSNSPHVKARFRVFQVISKLEQRGWKEAAKQASHFLRTGSESDLSADTVQKLLNYTYLIGDGHKAKFKTKQSLINHLHQLRTRKQTQKALVANQPAPAALSIPDDACHYHDNEQRTLSVREMARIQSFPDWFEFRSKATTGGHMRKFEVPQYTQVGNAVPPVLGLALGEVCSQFLDLAGSANNQ